MSFSLQASIYILHIVICSIIIFKNNDTTFSNPYLAGSTSLILLFLYFYFCPHYVYITSLFMCDVCVYPPAAFAACCLLFVIGSVLRFVDSRRCVVGFVFSDFHAEQIEISEPYGNMFLFHSGSGILPLPSCVYAMHGYNDSVLHEFPQRLSFSLFV